MTRRGRTAGEGGADRGGVPRPAARARAHGAVGVRAVAGRCGITACQAAEARLDALLDARFDRMTDARRPPARSVP